MTFWCKHFSDPSLGFQTPTASFKVASFHPFSRSTTTESCVLVQDVIVRSGGLAAVGPEGFAGTGARRDVARLLGLAPRGVPPGPSLVAGQSGGKPCNQASKMASVSGKPRDVTPGSPPPRSPGGGGSAAAPQRHHGFTLPGRSNVYGDRHCLHPALSGCSQGPFFDTICHCLVFIFNVMMMMKDSSNSLCQFFYHGHCLLLSLYICVISLKCNGNADFCLLVFFLFFF